MNWKGLGTTKPQACLSNRSRTKPSARLHDMESASLTGQTWHLSPDKGHDLGSRNHCSPDDEQL